MLEELLLISGNDIPFLSARINIHQPTINELSFIGEEAFFSAYQLLDFNKDRLEEEAKSNLIDMDDFDILMSIINDERAIQQKLYTTLLLTLLFPHCQIEIESDKISLIEEDDVYIINKDNYEDFKHILKLMFAFDSEEEKEFDPANDLAREIAEKIRRGREQVAKAKGQGSKKLTIFSRYLSILAIGLPMDINVLLNHTVYQLSDEFKRFQMKQAFDINLKARMAGATDLDDVDNWMDDIHP